MMWAWRRRSSRRAGPPARYSTTSQEKWRNRVSRHRPERLRPFHTRGIAARPMQERRATWQRRVRTIPEWSALWTLGQNGFVPPSNLRTRRRLGRASSAQLAENSSAALSMPKTNASSKPHPYLTGTTYFLAEKIPTLPISLAAAVKPLLLMFARVKGAASLSASGPRFPVLDNQISLATSPEDHTA